jgi:hypothetical protein
MRIRWAVALIVVGFIVACSGAWFGPPTAEGELMPAEDIPPFLLGVAIAIGGVYLLPRTSKLRERWKNAAREGEMTVRSATRLKTTAPAYVYAVDVEFDVPGITAPPGRYEISVGHGGERYLTVGSRIRVTAVEYEGRLLVRAHLHPRSPDPRAKDYYIDLQPIEAGGS